MTNDKHLFVLRLEHLDPELYNSATLLLEAEFFNEQNIPKALIPLQAINQKWWCIESNNAIIGTVAAWEIDSEWHWGRLAIHKNARGLGLGKALVIKSLDALFKTGIEKVIIDARDITAKMIVNVGGKRNGKTVSFYGQPITPMEIYKKDFIQ